MERITTPTAEVDKFGAGKNGFKGGGPPNATQLSPEWFDEVQEEIARVIEGQGIVLDGAQLDQLKQAIDDYIFQDPSIAGTLTVESGATLSVESGGEIQLDAGSLVDGGMTFGTGAASTFDVNATAEFEHAVTCRSNCQLGDDAGDAISVLGTTTFQEPATFNKLLTIIGGIGAGLTSDAAAVMEWFGVAAFQGRIRVLGSIISAVGDLAKDGAGNLHYHDGADRIAHVSDSGWFKGHNQVDVVAPTPSINLDTQAVAPKAPSDVSIVAHLQIRRAVAGDVEVSISEVGGVGTIGVVRTYTVPVTGGSKYEHVTFARTRLAADTTPRVYRVTVNGLGEDVDLGLGLIEATPAVG